MLLTVFGFVVMLALWGYGIGAAMAYSLQAPSVFTSVVGLLSIVILFGGAVKDEVRGYSPYARSYVAVLVTSTLLSVAFHIMTMAQ